MAPTQKQALCLSIRKLARNDELERDLLFFLLWAFGNVSASRRLAFVSTDSCEQHRVDSIFACHRRNDAVLPKGFPVALAPSAGHGNHVRFLYAILGFSPSIV